MIVSKRKPWDEIVVGLGGKTSVFLLGCGDCATACGSGGQTQLDEAAEYLRGRGLTVTGGAVPETACVAAVLKSALAPHLAKVRDSQAILVFACGLGVTSAKKNDRFGLIVTPACDTLFAATVDARGEFSEQCSLCGTCLLGRTGAICPVTRCAKGLLNGPCGGMNAGKCEVDREKDCAWVAIYRDFEQRGAVDRFRDIVPARDFARTTKPRSFKKE